MCRLRRVLVPLPITLLVACGVLGCQVLSSHVPTRAAPTASPADARLVAVTSANSSADSAATAEPSHVLPPTVGVDPSATLAVPPTRVRGPNVATVTKTAVATQTPWVLPPGFADTTYPSPLPVAPGVVLSLSGGCPNPAGIEQVNQVSLNSILQILGSLGSGDLNTMRHASDPAYWSTLQTTQWRRDPWPRDWIGTPQPASRSPYADLLTNACGKPIVETSWWVKLCPGPCQDPKVAAAESLTGHLFIIKRQGTPLAWAAK